MSASETKGSKVTRLRPVRPCPICDKSSAQKFHPFCSARCADVDLNRWLSGSYIIPARPEEDDEAESETPSPQVELRHD